jgi:hypothetical protein
MALKKLISTSNTAVENGVRLATYRALVEAGASKSEAASVASKLTVDFTQHGKYGPALNSLYLFANASIQGNLRMMQAGVRSKNVQRIVGGIVVGGFALQMLALASGGDDDSGEPYILGINDSIRERNMIFMIPGTKGKYHSMPMPYGYNTFFNAGAEAANMLYMALQGKDYDTVAGAGRIVTGFMNSFNPMASGTLLQTLAPTVLDPFAQPAENRNHMNMPLMPEQDKYGVKKPDSERYWKGVSVPSKGIAAMLNRLTGGDKFESGLLDISPETLDMLYETATGSAGKFVSNVLNLPARAITDDLPLHKIPITRRFVGAYDDRAISNRYYDAIDKGEIAKKRFDAAEAGLERMKVARSGDYQLFRRSQNIEKQLSTIRKTKKKAEARGDKASVEMFEKRIKTIQARFLEGLR